ncbi:MAG: hypothetical protein MK066_05615 [Crocinitomicaceae bacterium]|nr:hypothetical protein [Crocinitomicaceae bacterium]
MGDFLHLRMMNGTVKHILKKYLKYFKIRGRFVPSVKEKQNQLVQHYQDLQADQNLPLIENTGLKVFSQFEEDGKLLYLFSLLGMTNKTFIEFGSDDGINSNSANLYYNHGFNGLFMDGNDQALSRGRYFFKKHPNNVGQPIFKKAFIQAENINQLIKEGGIEGEIGLLSIDIDGNDYWVWKAITIVQPQVVIIETHNEFGLNDIVVPYDPNYMYPGKHPTYHGASPVAMTKLAKNKGYRLVGSNELGFNFIFIKEDLLVNEVPTVSVESLLQHPSNKDAQTRFEAVKDWEFVTEEFE